MQQELVATQAFLTSMRRSWLALGGQGECPVKAMENYPAPQRMALVKAIGAALESANKEKAP